MSTSAHTRHQAPEGDRDRREDRRDDRREDRAGEHEAVEFTPRGLRALDALADVLVHQMADTPDGIAYVLDQVLHAPLDELCGALDAVAAGISDRTPGHALRRPPGRGRT